MKKIILSMLLLAAAPLSSMADNVLHLKGKSDVPGGKLVYYTMDFVAREWSSPDTIQVAADGSFKLNMSLDQPITLFIYAHPKEKGMMPLNIRVLGVPGENMTLDIKGKSYKLGGSQFYEKLGQATDESDTDELVQKLVKSLDRMQADSVNADSIESFRQREVEKIRIFKENALLGFIRRNIQNDVSIALLNQLTWRSFFDIDASLPQATKSGRLKKVYDSAFGVFNQAREKERNSEKIKEGKPAPTFALNDIKGKPFDLKELRGKYVVLDFWGSWCGWCIKGFPEMKTAYAKYKDKMEIVGIDCNDSEAKWRAAVEKNELPWRHVRSDRQKGGIEVTYAIKGYPTKILLNPKGNIEKVFEGEGEDFYKYLDSLFNKQ